MFFLQTLAVGISCAISLVVVLRWTHRRDYPLPLPPGPRPLPFLGNALQVDTTRPWLTYTAWGKVYGWWISGPISKLLCLTSCLIIGDIIYSRLLGIDMIIINSDAIARELLNKRSAIYSDRPVIRTQELYVLHTHDSASA